MCRVANFNNLLWSYVSGCKWILENVVCGLYLGQYPIGGNELSIGKYNALFSSDEEGGSIKNGCQERGKSIRCSHCGLGVVIGGIIFVGGGTILAVGVD